VEWERKRDETKRKLREKKEIEKIFIDNDRTILQNKNERYRRTIAKEEKREGKEVNRGGTVEMEWRNGEIRDFPVGRGIGDGENGDNGNGTRTKKKVEGQRKCEPEKKRKGEHKKEDTKGTSKKDNETLQVFKSLRPVLAWSVANTYRMKCVSHNS
jgi:hypothetical protein